MNRSSSRRRYAGLAFALISLTLGGCASRPAPPVTPPPTIPERPELPIDQKVGWILRLEQQRVLRDPPLAANEPPAPGQRPLLRAATADLTELSLDPDSGVRRRAMLALGRVRMGEALPWLVSALADTDAPVRAEAAFAIGLLGAREGAEPLAAALADPDPMVRGRAAQGLGLLGDATRAPAIADAFTMCAASLAPLASDDEAAVTFEAEACRLALFALVRLRNYDAIARVALDASGAPVSRWWPVAFALQRSGDRRAAPALLQLASSAGVYTPSFALRGLGALRDRGAFALSQALAMQADADPRLRVVAVRTLAQVGGPDAVQPIAKLAFAAETPTNLALEAIAALGTLGDRQVFPELIDQFTSPSPAVRLAAMTAAARVDADGFLLVVSSLPPDPDPVVRAGLAGVLGRFDLARALPPLEQLASDEDVRVVGPALEALSRVKAPDLAERLLRALDTADFAVRATAARLIGDTKIPGAAPKLAEAYERGLSDATEAARSAAIAALATYGRDAAEPTLRKALADPDWSVRIQAATALVALGDPTAAPTRPAPMRESPDLFTSPAFLHPEFSPHAYIETRHGTIEIELNVVQSPLTTRSFIALARSGFYNGIRIHRLIPNFVIQAGDPRGDGAGGPGYTIRDELSTLPFVRGTVGMALSGPETGGSQFFITLSPQPHLDGQYTVFGRVVAGHDILDVVSPWDVIERIRIWDGVVFKH
ncbi:MAG TPA: HEAT repeat domain-containing protein [Vicinamibacterales bacterium]|nr:HEAT repeat domain-containing protein [Vicinamibacterales bacterium]